MKNFLVSRFSSLLLILALVPPVYAHETATLKNVMDGDTLKVQYKGGKENIRLIGIDAPESRTNRKPRRIFKGAGRTTGKC